MSNLEFFKNEAKKFLKDWQTQTQTVESDGLIVYHYDWKFYDVGSLFLYYELDDKDEQDIKLSRAQHYISKMIGFKKWDDLIHSSKIELVLAEFLLRHFKNAYDVQQWEEITDNTGITPENAASKLEYANYVYELSEKLNIVYLPVEQITILSGKPRIKEFNQFSDENNPNGILRKDSYVFCPHCNKAFDFKKSKVIKSNDSNLTTIVCKNYPNCRGTYNDYQILTPTIMFGEVRKAELERGIKLFKTHFTMNTKVHCLHCGKEYLYNEASVVHQADTDDNLVYCKHYPECDGSLIDMMTE